MRIRILNTEYQRGQLKRAGRDGDRDGRYKEGTDTERGLKGADV
jgi:hypothetical protein